jgi:hypothetical protein
VCNVVSTALNGTSWTPALAENPDDPKDMSTYHGFLEAALSWVSGSPLHLVSGLLSHSPVNCDNVADCW